MVFYIRFLKVPTITPPPPNQSLFTIKTVITITSDLGDAFYSCDAELYLHLECDGLSRTLTNRVLWTAGARALPVECALKSKDYAGLLRLCISGSPSPAAPVLGTGHVPSLVPAWSDTFQAVTLGPTQRRVERRFELGSDRWLRIWEETGESIARHVWDAGIGFVAHLRDVVQNQLETEISSKIRDHVRRAEFTPLRVIELGSGCGIAGIALAQLAPCHVLLTDLPEAMEILSLNISVARLAKGSELDKMPLDWEEAYPSSLHNMPFDIVLVSDCTYNPDSLPALVRTVSAITSVSPDILVVVAMKVRHASETVFFDLMAEAGFIEMERTRIDLPDLPQSLAEKTPEVVEIYTFRSGREASAVAEC